MISEARVGAVLATIGVAISIAVYVVTGNGDRDTSNTTRSSSSEERAEMVFSPTGKFTSGDPSTALVLHAFQVTPDYISVVYTLVGRPLDKLLSASLVIVDDKGRAYRVLGNSILGSKDGVLAGVLVVEPHIQGGSILSIQLTDIDLADGATRKVDWRVPFLQTKQPDVPITFIEGGRLSPEEGVTVYGATVGIAGPPGSSPVEILVNRNGTTTSLFGMVDQEGATRAISQQEFESALGVSGYPKPPAFPTAAAASP